MQPSSTWEGPERSGSAMTTFLRGLNHLDRIDVGEILFHGRPVGYGPRRSGSSPDP